MTAYFPSQKGCDIHTLTDVWTLKSYLIIQILKSIQHKNQYLVQLLKDNLKHWTIVLLNKEWIKRTNKSSLEFHSKNVSSLQMIVGWNTSIKPSTLKQDRGLSIVCVQYQENLNNINHCMDCTWIIVLPIILLTKRKSHTINSCHMNAYVIIPILVHNLVDKLHPDKLVKHNDLKVNMIHFMTQVGYGMRKTPSIQIHPAVYHYCKDTNNRGFTQGLMVFIWLFLLLCS